MTPLEMVTVCLDGLAKDPLRDVLFVLPKGGTPKGFPRGELASELQRNGVIERAMWFKPLKVLEWLHKNGLIIIERTSDTSMVVKVPNENITGR